MNTFDNRLYFAYGSNLNVEQMLERCPTAAPVRRFAINGWKLVFRDYADIEPCAGATVHGAFYRVTKADVAALDLYEGVHNGLYRQVTFRISGTKELGFFYVMNDDGNYPPCSYYLDTIVEGYGDWQLPLDSLYEAHKASLDWADAIDAQNVELDSSFLAEALPE